jgi:catechol 2,3-dioxygenase-like lactoylglutathione lyase family enzyme
MIDHLTTYATDYDATVTFYDAVLPLLGYTRSVNMVTHWDAAFPERRVCAYGPGTQPVYWVSEVRVAATPRHVAFRAPNQDAVRAFHAAALSTGATDNGAPGPRQQYHPQYFGAFVFDPDGNNVEAVHHGKMA